MSGGIFYNQEAYDDLLFGRGDEDYPNPDDRVCRYCKRGGLHWKQVYGRWRLVEPLGKLHQCKEYQKQWLTSRLRRRSA